MGTLRMLSKLRTPLEAVFSRPLLRATQHVIYQRSVDIRAAKANRLEQRFVIRDKVSPVHELFDQDLLMT
jgi:hypothetical protein